MEPCSRHDVGEDGKLIAMHTWDESPCEHISEMGAAMTAIRREIQLPGGGAGMSATKREVQLRTELDASRARVIELERRAHEVANRPEFARMVVYILTGRTAPGPQ